MKNDQLKSQKRPLFQEGTFLHTICYKMTERVKAGEISFAKVFWVGFLIIAVINIILVFVFDVSQITKEILEVIWCLIWARHLWY
jgi:ABC-type Co2+ transport system permease subunit